MKPFCWLLCSFHQAECPTPAAKNIQISPPHSCHKLVEAFTKRLIPFKMVVQKPFRQRMLASKDRCWCQVVWILEQRYALARNCPCRLFIWQRQTSQEPRQALPIACFDLAGLHYPPLPLHVPCVNVHNIYVTQKLITFTMMRHVI